MGGKSDRDNRRWDRREKEGRKELRRGEYRDKEYKHSIEEIRGGCAVRDSAQERERHGN